jgi:pimeloyl-ACP methyl ester carboxylesterase
MTLTDLELDQIERANSSGLSPVMFIHGLWLLPNSWDRWVKLFEEAGYVAITPGWPDDPQTVEEARADTSVFAGKSVGDVADHYSEAAERLNKKPIILGHSFGGLLVQIVSGRGLAAATVSISPAPFRGVLPLPLVALRSSSAVLHNPANRHRSITLTPEQFRFGFGNAVSEEESNELYEEFHVAGSGEPLFQAAAANVNPWTEAKVDFKNPDRGPLLLIASAADHTAPAAIAKAAFSKQLKNPAITEYYEFKDRGHSLVVDNGWHDVAVVSLDFARRVVPPVDAPLATV